MRLIALGLMLLCSFDSGLPALAASTLLGTSQDKQDPLKEKLPRLKPAEPKDAAKTFVLKPGYTIESAKAPLLRTTLKKPQRSGAAGRGTSNPTTTSSGARDV